MGSILLPLVMAMVFLASGPVGQELHDEASACNEITSRDSHVLQANLHKFGEEAVLGGPARTYILEAMKPKSTYEVRISHTAAVPAQFHLELQRCHGPLLEGNMAAGEAPTRAPSARKLLDTEKIILMSSDFPASEQEEPGNDGIKQGGRAVVFISATQRGRRRASQGPSSGTTKPDGHSDDGFIVRYNIVLQELWLGIIPLDSIPMGAALVAGLAFALWIAFAVSRDDSSSSPPDEGRISRRDDEGKEQ